MFPPGVKIDKRCGTRDLSDCGNYSRIRGGVNFISEEKKGEVDGNSRRGGGDRSGASALGRLLQALVFLGADALLGKGAPLDAGRAHGPGVHVPALLARRVGLIGPDFDLLAALLAPDVFRLRRPYFSASWAAFLEHGHTIILPRRKRYDAGHTSSAAVIPSPRR